MNVGIMAFVTAVVCISVTGCRNGETATESETQAWGTRDQSVLAKDPVLPKLSIPAPLTGQTIEELREAAVSLLLQAADSTNPLLRKHAVESLQQAPDSLERTVQLSLGDTNRGVRFAAAWTVGQMQLQSLADLVSPMLDDESKSVRAAAIYALRRCGRNADPTPLAEMVLSDNPEVKGNATLVLGELGDPSALPILRAAIGGEPSEWTPAARAKIVDLQIAEAMVKLGKKNEIEAIRAALFAPGEHGELTALACQMCGGLMDTGSIPTLKDMAHRQGRDQPSAEIRLAATQALAQLDPSPALSEIPLAYTGSDVFQIRALSAVALGWIGDPATLPVLAAMMEDTNALVQVAAAGAILRVTRGG